MQLARSQPAAGLVSALSRCHATTQHKPRQTGADMSSSFSANQYDGAFSAQRLQNWCDTKHFKERPTAHGGRTSFIADDRGHLISGRVKRGSAWPDFKGTWDLPARIPAPSINRTSRSVEGLERLKAWGLDPQNTDKCQPQRGSKNTARLQDAAGKTDGNVLQDGAGPARPGSHTLPGTGGQMTASPDRERQAAEVRSAAGPAEEEGAPRAPEEDRPVSQGSAAGGRTSGTDGAVEDRPQSIMAERATPSSSRQRHRSAQLDQ